MFNLLMGRAEQVEHFKKFRRLLPTAQHHESRPTHLKTRKKLIKYLMFEEVAIFCVILLSNSIQYSY